MSTSAGDRRRRPRRRGRARDRPPPRGHRRGGTRRGAARAPRASARGRGGGDGPRRPPWSGDAARAAGALRRAARARRGARPTGRHPQPCSQPRDGGRPRAVPRNGRPALLLGARPARARTRARVLRVLRRERHVPEGRRASRVRRRRPGGSPARGDRQPVPRPAAGSRPTERADARAPHALDARRRPGRRRRRRSRRASTRTPPGRSGSTREPGHAEEGIRAALPRRPERARRHRPPRRARAGRRRPGGRAGPRRPDDLPRRPRAARPCRRDRSEARGAPAHGAGRAGQRDPRLRRRPRPRHLGARPAAAEARRQPAVQRRDSARRRDADRRPGARVLVRDGAAGGRRPVLRRARDEGVRGRIGAGPAARPSHGIPSGVADGVPAAAERRLGPRRVRANRAPGQRRSRAPSRLRCVLPPAEDPRERAGARRTSSPREVAVEALAAIDRPPAIRAEALEPEEFVRLTEALPA